MSVLKKFHDYLLYQKFKLLTDHEVSKFVIITIYLHGNIFVEYDFEVIYCTAQFHRNKYRLSFPPSRKIKCCVNYRMIIDMKSVADYLTQETMRRASSSAARSQSMFQVLSHV